VIAMMVHTNITEVQEYGCLALFNLTFNKSVAVRILQLEGGLAVLKQNPSNSNAKRALKRIKAAKRALQRNKAAKRALQWIKALIILG
jgi:hypothetical protein